MIDRAEFAVRRNAAVLSLIVGVAMLGAKWVAYVATGSHAILSDALESIVHLAATAFALVSVILSSRPPDPKYPYGYGKIGYFSAGFEGGLIALAALAIFYESVRGLLAPTELTQLDLGFGLILAASVVNLVLGLWLIRVGRRSGSLILLADGKHVLADSYTSFGVVVGVALVRLTGWYVLDPAVAVLVGLNILWTGYHLVRESYLGLMDRADEAMLGRIVDTLQSVRHEGWIDVHHLRSWGTGDRIFVDFHLVVPADWTVVGLHEAHDLIREALKAELGPDTEVIIHFDPDSPDRGWNRPGEPWTLSRAVRVPERKDADLASISSD